MKRNALVVGIDEYRIKPLSGCVNDATSVADILKQSNYGFDVTVLLNSEVTRRTLRTELKKVLDSDFSVIYFAGHGCRTNVATYLVTSDTEPEDEGVDFGFITQALAQLAKPNQTVAILLDCCHAGDASTRSTEGFPAPLESRDIPSPSGNGKVVMAACMGNQTATEKVINGKHHGLFTHYLLQAMKGAAADPNGLVTVSSIYDYVSDALAKDNAQVPVLRGDQTGRIILGSGLPPSGLHNPAAPASKYKEDQVACEAQEYAVRYYANTPQYTHPEWQSRGHLESCQRLAPIVEWFERRIEDNPDLQRNTTFSKSQANIYQQYQQLCNLTPGTVLDKSREVDSLLGAGTFGTVWRILDKKDNADICFKSYHATELRDREKIGRFNRGYKAMTQLNHPNIIKVYEDSKVPLGFYMQYIDGPNLRQFNPATSLDPAQLIDLLLRIGETLQHAHGRDVLHRDVKPENILLHFDDTGGAPTPYLTDFDLSWFSTATKLTRLAEGFGSHFYAAPEQMNNPMSPIAHKSSVDAYSFGQIIFYTFCGRDPAAFDEPGNQEAFSERLRKVSVSEKASRLLLDLYSNLTIRTPAKREGDFRRICDKLSAILALIRTTGGTMSSAELLRELRFSVAGLSSDATNHSETQGIVSFKSPSFRTEVITRIKQETVDQLTLEVTLVPDSIVVPGASAVSARQTVNARIDASLAAYNKPNNLRRTAPSSGNFQTIISFEHINKTVEGLSLAREIIMHAVDAVERT